MAQTLKEKVAVGESVRSASHGRGGAGNINARPSSTIEAADLKTPTLKSQTYTTGRGGQGNMKINQDPAMARAAQDVEAPAHHEKEAKGTYHWGRGGEGNVMTVGTEKEGQAQRAKSKERKGSKGAADGRRGSFQGVLDKGKELLGLGKGKQQSEKDGAAIVE
ncbi:hypothetical protein LTR36_002363 [Oleoguttula mirabilis]|uniref:Uncharacterized protein n=1 Tax=Oleoguttula mirabilis TaxID=1507867 RepID=A0AAV9JMQ7_9PEZI|nr:hypothetical protein LTR36_002363 [Oleoguttula mirabilis]